MWGMPKTKVSLQVIYELIDMGEKTQTFYP